jgi:hypothetical protein
VEAGENQGVRGSYYVVGGQVVEGRSDLAKRFPEKFDRVDDSKRVTAHWVPNDEDGTQGTVAPYNTDYVERKEVTPVAPSAPQSNNQAVNTFETYREMTIAELKQQAVEDRVDLGTARTKDQILDMFRQHLGLVEEAK